MLTIEYNKMKEIMRAQFFEAKQDWLTKMNKKYVPLKVRSKGGRTLRRYLSEHCSYEETYKNKENAIIVDLTYTFKGKERESIRIKLIIKVDKEDGKDN